jgi:hypothetical protein
MNRYARGIGAGIALAVIAVLGFPATPAGAVTYTNAHVHSGTMTLWDPSSNISTGSNMAVTCQQASTFDFSGGTTGTYTASTTYRQDTTIFGAPTVVEVRLDHAGAYGPGSPIPVSGTGTATAVFRTRTAPCTDDGIDDCTITMNNVALSGSLDDHGNGINGLTGGHAPTGDNLAMAGGNVTGDNVVTGPSCGFISVVLNGGHTDLTGVVWDDF